MRSCSSCDHFPQDNHCMGCIYDHDIGGNTKWESKTDPDVIERKVIDDIRKEITEKIEIYTHEFKLDDTPVDYGCRSGLNIALKVIDRHIGESKDAEWKKSEPLDDVVELMKGESE